MANQVFYSNQRPSSHVGAVSIWLLAPIILIGGIAIFYLLFANTILKNLSESQLGQSLGAEVNIADLDHSLLPFGIEISGLQATDNAKPTHNKFETALIQADVNFMPLLSGKVIMDNLIINELTFDTLREKPGEVYKAAESSSNFAFPSLDDLPSVDEVLANSPLKSTQAIADAQSVYEKYEQPLKEKYQALADKDKIQTYKDKIKSLQDTDFKDPLAFTQAIETLQQLKQDIQKEKQNFAEFKSLAASANTEINDSLNNLKTAPQEDFELLKGLVAGDEAAIGKVSQHLFGDKAELYVKAILTAADLALNSGNDKPTEVKIDDSGLPNLWIKNAEISVQLMQQRLETNWSNITENHALVGEPTSFLVNSLETELWDAIRIDGDFSVIEGAINGKQNWDLTNLALSAIALVPENAKQSLSAILDSGILNSRGGITIQGNEINGNSDFNLSDLSLTAAGSNDLTKTIATIIEQQDTVNLNTSISGAVTQPSIGVSSDLDKKLLSSFASNLDSNPKLQELQQKLDNKVSEQLGVSGEQLTNINSLLSAVNGDMNSLDKLLNAQLADPKDKITDKLKGFFK